MWIVAPQAFFSFFFPEHPTSDRIDFRYIFLGGGADGVSGGAKCLGGGQHLCLAEVGQNHKQMHRHRDIAT